MSKLSTTMKPSPQLNKKKEKEDKALVRLVASPRARQCSPPLQTAIHQRNLLHVRTASVCCSDQLQFTFQYCNAKPAATKFALVKMKDEDGTDPYFMVLMQNDLVLYKGKGEPAIEAYHTKVYNVLTNIEGLGVRVSANISPASIFRGLTLRSQPNPKGDPGIAFMNIKKAKDGKEGKAKQVLIFMDTAAQQAEWLERLNKLIATLRPWWQTLQEAGGESIIEEMIAALPRNGACQLPNWAD